MRALAAQKKTRHRGACVAFWCLNTWTRDQFNAFDFRWNTILIAWRRHLLTSQLTAKKKKSFDKFGSYLSSFSTFLHNVFLRSIFHFLCVHLLSLPFAVYFMRLLFVRVYVWCSHTSTLLLTLNIVCWWCCCLFLLNILIHFFLSEFCWHTKSKKKNDIAFVLISNCGTNVWRCFLVHSASGMSGGYCFSNFCARLEYPPISEKRHTPTIAVNATACTSAATLDRILQKPSFFNVFGQSPNTQLAYGGKSCHSLK